VPPLFLQGRKLHENGFWLYESFLGSDGWNELGPDYEDAYVAVPRSVTRFKPDRHCLPKGSLMWQEGRWNEPPSYWKMI
jgi:hypothetical protein